MEPKRIMVVDDNEAIHYDFRKALEVNKKDTQLEEIRNKVFPEHNPLPNIYESYPSFVIDSALQGLDAIKLLKSNLEKDQRYSLAFIDILMPPGIDGVTTIEKLWELDPDLQVVICTAHADYSYEEIYQRLKGSDNFLILKKPFDIIEILQLGSSLTRKWELAQQARRQLQRQRDQLHNFFQEADFLYRLSQLSQTEYSTKNTLQFYINELCSLRHWPLGHIYQADEESLQLHSTDIWYLNDPERFQLYKETVSQITYQPGVGLPGHVLESKTPYWIENIKQETTIPETKILVDCGIKGALAVPIKVADKVIAVIELFSDEPLHRDQKLLELTIASANQLGLLLERRRNEKELKENYEKLQLLYKEMRNTQAQLLQHAKLVSIGQLAAGVAHEINNPIAYVMSNTQVLNNYIKVFKELFTSFHSNTKTQIEWEKIAEEHNLPFIINDGEEIVKESLEGLERVREIVADLKSFSHTDEAEIQEADINHCIDVTLKMIWNELKYKCEVIKDYGKLPQLRCYARQLNQVFMNLLVNASQAIVGKHGTIKIITRCQDEAIQVLIEDDGEGIIPEYMEKLFDPFFTSKPIGTGTGLGLSISYNIIKKHSGTILVESEGKGKGTRFIVTLPLNGLEKSK